MSLFDSLRRRIAPTIEEEESDPLGWRERVLFTVLVFVLVFGALTAAPSIWLAWRDGQAGTVIVDFAGLAAAGLLTFHPRIPFRWRAGGLLVSCYLVGVWFLVTVGLVSQIYLMAVPILAALLLGLRPAIFALVVNTATLALVGYFGAADLPMGKLESAPLIKWMLISFNFVFVDAVLTISIAVVYRRLERSLVRELAAAASLTRLARAVEQSREGILISDTSGRLVYANKAYETLTGRTLSPDTTHHLQDLPTGATDTHPLVVAIAEQRDWGGTVSLAAAGGVPRQLETVVAPLRDADGQVLNFVAVMRDVTRERAMEDRQRQGQKLEAIGTLTGGIAHDFNNIIGSILAVAEFTRDEAGTGAAAAGFEQIIIACNRAREIVRKMMAFTRQSALTREPISVATAVEETLPLLRAAIASTIGFQVDLRTRGWASVDPAEVHQILMNLATNGAHAMAGQDAGMLRFSLSEFTPDEMAASASQHLQPGVRYLVLEVADTGHGIAKEHLDRIFDPFFSTKRPAEGTGLGLASVHGIVRSLGGDIGVYTERGLGTSFRIYLPEVAVPAGNALPAPEPAAIPPAGGARVLLVDDEPALLSVHARVLTRAGYAVTSAADGAVALRLFRDDPNQFDLVITDLSMPEIGGLELIRAVRAMSPGILVVLSSGFSNAAAADELAAAAVDGFLQKPCTQKELLQLVARTLATPAAG